MGNLILQESEWGVFRSDSPVLGPLVLRIALHHKFLTRDDSAPQGTLETVCRHVMTVGEGGASGTGWVEARGAVQLPTVSKTGPQQKMTRCQVSILWRQKPGLSVRGSVHLSTLSEFSLR